MDKIQSYAQFFVVVGLALILVAVGQLGNGRIAWADGTQYQTVPTRTPTPGSSDNNDNNNNSDEPFSQIIGQVTDLATGQPGAGIIVLINDIEISTDSNGKYSLSGLQAGEFTISLRLTEGVPAGEETRIVTVDGQTDTVVDLEYYSDASLAQATATPAPEAEATPTPAQEGDTAAAPEDAAPTPTTAPAETTTQAAQATTNEAADSTTPDENPPEALPQSGAFIYNYWVVLMVGLALVILGVKLNYAGKKA